MKNPYQHWFVDSELEKADG